MLQDIHNAILELKFSGAKSQNPSNRAHLSNINFPFIPLYLQTEYRSSLGNTCPDMYSEHRPETV